MIPQLRHFDMTNIRRYALRVKTQYRRLNNRRRLETFDMEYMVSEGLLPPNGIGELQDAILSTIPSVVEWVCIYLVNFIHFNLHVLISMCVQVKAMVKDDKLFTPRLMSRFIKVMITTIYCCSPQGRPLAFERITYGEFMSSWNHHVDPFSRHLKTSLSLHYQVISIVGEAAEELVDYYVNDIRPRILANLNRTTRGKSAYYFTFSCFCM